MWSYGFKFTFVAVLLRLCVALGRPKVPNLDILRRRSRPGQLVGNRHVSRGALTWGFEHLFRRWSSRVSLLG